MNEQQHQDNSFWVGLFLGGLIGALLIVLLGTEKGKKLADKLQEEGLDFLSDTKEKVEGKIGELEHRGEKLIEQGKELEKELVATVSEAGADLSEEVAEKTDEALAHIEKLQERGRATTANLRKQLFKNIPKKTG